jgi:predicted nucleic acid-binding protein
MDLVIDANVLFSILINEGKTEELLFQEHISAFAPEFLLIEFQKYEKLILKKTKRSHSEFQELIGILKKRIAIVPNRETNHYMERAREISPDRKDTDYFALALKLKCAIWSNDKELKSQSAIRVFSTEDLMTMFSI